jgi:hypothetical protein
VVRISNGRIGASFRDPSGFMFLRDGILYRQINVIYKENYDFLFSSGLYNILINKNLLIPHTQVNITPEEPDKSYKIIKPELIKFISYPHEWCFSQLKDAALTTLKIQKLAIESGMILKDASAYNIQYRNCKPVLIDTLSFERYQEGKPWNAYRQFCQHFLAPLALMSYNDVRLNQLFRIFIDGIPLDLASSILPLRSCFNFPLFAHIQLHAVSQRHLSKRYKSIHTYKMSKFRLLALMDNLEYAINLLKGRFLNTQWTEYNEYDSYSQVAFCHKKQIVSEFIDRIMPQNVGDFGANAGVFSRIVSTKGIYTISFDADQHIVEKNYLACIKNNETDLLPLTMDLTNPTNNIGWQNQETLSLLERGPIDAVFALALIHHLAFFNNVPFDKLASFFSQICKFLIIEFIPKSDPQVQKILSSREDVFVGYTQQQFETDFTRVFNIENMVNLKDSKRILYLMRNKEF